MLIFLTEKNGEAPCAYFSYVLNFFEVQRVHVLIKEECTNVSSTTLPKWIVAVS